MATWLTVIVSAIASVLAACVAAWAAVKVAKVNAESEEKKEEREDKERRRQEEDEVHRKINERLDLVEKSCKCLLRGDIIRTYNHYTEKHYLPIYAEENLDEAFSAYKRLHGNGTIEDLVADLKQLKHEPPAN